VSGGSLNDAYRAELADGRTVFVKTRRAPDRNEFVIEAQNLEWLREADALPLPGLVLAGEDFLVLDWVETGPPLDPAGEEAFGRGLAALHASGVPFFGAGQPLLLGSLRLENEPVEDDWAAFYAERRLRPLAERTGLADVVEPVCRRLAHLAGPPEPPARLHGDLWTGNVLAGADGRAWLGEPVAYGGHREVDLAMLELFGGRNERVHGAYREAAPLADGWEERVGLWQLFPLLVHAFLFGGGYVEQVRRTARGLA
jgi:fructosamine-3-kinase